MARIAYDQSDVRVQQRLIDSFWTLLETLPFKKVTISKLVELASCNRASFYYHYQDTGDLLQKALEQELVRGAGIISVLADSLSGDGDEGCAGLFGQPKLMLAFRQVERGVLSEHLQSFFGRLWTVVLCQEGEELGHDAREVVAFFVDGMLGALSRALSAGSPEWGSPACEVGAFCVAQMGVLYGLEKSEIAARLHMANRVWSSLG